MTNGEQTPGAGQPTPRRFGVVSLFPDMFTALTGHGVTGRGLERGLWELSCWNPRDYATDNYRTVDDRPYGGGPGMVMLAEPLYQAIGAARETLPGAPVLLLSPQGTRLDHAMVTRLGALNEGFVLVAGRYEGVDERLIEAAVDEELSIGDYVLSGGELAAMVVLDAVVRQLPGVLGDADSAREDSFVAGLLDHPHYTRPEDWRGRGVPEILLSGHHERIRRWRLGTALARTARRRPDLLAGRTPDREERELLAHMGREQEMKSDGVDK